MKQRTPPAFLLTVFLASACVGGVPDNGQAGGADANQASNGDSGVAPDAQVQASCSGPVVPLDVPRPVSIMANSDLGELIPRFPCVTDPHLRGLLSSPDTMWYDKRSIVPGYQDSFGDNVIAPIGMRPNTIDAGLINLAVPGGHGWIFESRGNFHFPFGDPAGFGDGGQVVDFWHVPRRDGDLLPVVWRQRDPNNLTHRVNWLFPAGTVLGEVIFIRDQGQLYPFEIRTRTRTSDGWASDAYRPFPRAEDLALALERKRTEQAAWSSSAEIDELIAHLRDNTTLTAKTISAIAFESAFPDLSGAFDTLPGLTSDRTIIEELLLETPFRSAKDTVWKEKGAMRTYAPTLASGFNVVPKGYNGGLFKVDDETCSKCHQDAGRPFRDWYPDILAYGELWGEDESFTWHPFDRSRFVNAAGEVLEFNYDNRAFRSDFVSAGLLEPFDAGRHPESTWKAIPRAWKNYAY